MLKPYLGLGAGAHSYTHVGGSGRMRRWNISDPRCYVEAVRNSKNGIEGEERLSGKTTLKEAIFLGLRQLKGINLLDFKRSFGVSLDEAYPELLVSLVNAGLMDVTPDTLKLTPQGVLLSNEVFYQFF